MNIYWITRSVLKVQLAFYDWQLKFVLCSRILIVIFVDGKALARTHFVKYIETSPGMFRGLSSGVCHVVVAGINHNIDELLVGVVKQVRLREVKEKRKKKTKVNLRQEPVAIFSNLIFCSRCGENFLEKF